MRDWKEIWVDEMGLIVALSGENRFLRMESFRFRMSRLTVDQQRELKETLRQRFSPSNGQDGCREAMEAVQQVSNGG